jgi:hypothetical protein
VKKMVTEEHEWRRIKHRRKEVSDMLNMLEPFSPKEKHEKSHHLRQAGTGGWFYKYFLDWVYNKSDVAAQVLWLSGKCKSWPKGPLTHILMYRD